MSAELTAQVSARFGGEVTQDYGMPELSPASHLTGQGRGKPGSDGVTVPNTQVRVVDPATGEDVSDGLAAHRRPGARRRRRTPVRRRPAQGAHQGQGLPGGPAELEALLLTHPDVTDAAVIGVPDDEAGELPAAYLVLRPDAEASEATEADIRAFVAGQVAHDKRLGPVTLLEAIPMSPSGKILRRVLRAGALAPA